MLTTQSTLSVARQAKELADSIKALYGRASALKRHIVARGYNFTADQTYIDIGPDDNIVGTDFSRADLNAALTAMDQFVRAMSNQTITQGDHIATIEKLAQP